MEEQFPHLLQDVQRILESGGGRKGKLAAIADTLRAAVPHYDWVGFYLADPGEAELALGPYSGEPTEHVRIPFGRGICGRAAAERAMVVCQDVSGEANYLSCSPKVRSEVVVPIFGAGRIVAELDIDSHTPSAFSEEDRAFLVKVCEAVSALF
jgi:L-methionine (R)-S-oxide reductase